MCSITSKFKWRVNAMYKYKKSKVFNMHLQTITETYLEYIMNYYVNLWAKVMVSAVCTHPKFASNMLVH